MPIPLFLLDRIKTSAMSGEQVADAFAKLAHVADKAESDGCAINLEYVADGDKLLPGDLIPTITLSLDRQKEAMEPVPADVIDVEPQLNLMLFILGVVGMTHIVVDSEISEPVHEWIEPRLPVVARIMDCYQCAGFWCGIALGLVLLSYRPARRLRRWLRRQLPGATRLARARFVGTLREGRVIRRRT